jgi:curved DNA-binding protein CbpA
MISAAYEILRDERKKSIYIQDFRGGDQWMKERHSSGPGRSNYENVQADFDKAEKAHREYPIALSPYSLMYYITFIVKLTGNSLYGSVFFVVLLLPLSIHRWEKNFQIHAII